MMMRRGMVVLFGMGAGAALLVLAIGNRGSSTTLAVPKVTMLVANRDINAGETLSRSDYDWQAVPKETAPREGIGRKDEVVAQLKEMRMRRTVLAGEPILKSMLISREKDTGILAAMLEPGQRAVSIPVSVKNSAGGFVRPGDYVDVMMTYQIRLDGDTEDRQAALGIVSRHATETVLERVRVLAVDQVIRDDRDAAPARTVTVAVSRKQAETLALAMEMGDLSLSLRAISAAGDGEAEPPEDDQDEFTTDIGIGKAMRAAAEAMRAASTSHDSGAPVPVSGHGGPSIRIYQGASVQYVTLGQR